MQKTVRGQLLEKKSQKLLADVIVVITLIAARNPNDRPRYRVSITTDKYMPDLDMKTHTLKLSENLSGEVQINITGQPSRNQTKFTVILQDPIWNNLDWFNNLPTE